VGLSTAATLDRPEEPKDGFLDIGSSALEEARRLDGRRC
jgi:hypothetical protein